MSSYHTTQGRGCKWKEVRNALKLRRRDLDNPNWGASLVRVCRTLASEKAWQTGEERGQLTGMVRTGSPPSQASTPAESWFETLWLMDGQTRERGKLKRYQESRCGHEVSRRGNTAGRSALLWSIRDKGHVRRTQWFERYSFPFFLRTSILFKRHWHWIWEAQVFFFFKCFLRSQFSPQTTFRFSLGVVQLCWP